LQKPKEYIWDKALGITFIILLIATLPIAAIIGIISGTREWYNTRK